MFVSPMYMTLFSGKANPVAINFWRGAGSGMRHWNCHFKTHLEPAFFLLSDIVACHGTGS